MTVLLEHPTDVLELAANDVQISPVDNARSVVPPDGQPLDTWESSDSQYSMNAALQLGLPVTVVSGNLQSRVIVRDVRATRQVIKGDEVLVYGVSLRLVITVSATELEAKMTSSIPVISAHAELQQLRADARLSLVGFTDQGVLGLFPNFSSLDVESYGKYTLASDDIRKYVAQHPGAIAPVLLERRPHVTDDSIANLSDAVATTRALQALADGRSLQWTLNSLDNSSNVQAAVRKVWSLVTDTIPENAQPPEWVRARAQQLLDG